MTATLIRLLEAARLDEKHASVLPLERRVQRALRSAWRGQAAAVRAALRRPWFEESRSLAEAISPDEADEVAAAVTADTALVAELQLVLVEAAGRGARDTGRELALALGADWAIENPAAVAWLSERGAARVAGIDDVTRGYVRTILVQAADEGWSYQRTSKALRDRFVGFSARSPLGHVRNRGELIAITEVGEAYEHAGRQVALDLAADGLVIEKQWLTAADAKVCQVCAPAGMQDWIGEDDVFTNGLTGPLGHPGCRCACTRRVQPDDEEVS